MDSPTVLYVEDNPTNFRLVERLLTKDGFRVLHARDGLEGIQKAVGEKAGLDLILMDINLPEMDGYETTSRLRSLPGFERIPILAVTVNTLQGDRKRSLAAGCDGFIPKPIDVATFSSEVRKYLAGVRETLPVEEENHYLREHNLKLVERLEDSLRGLQASQRHTRQSQKMASVGEMAAGLLHEIKNPLSSIYFLAEYLLTATGDEEKKGQYLERIVDNVARIQELSKRLGSFVRPAEESKGFVDVGTSIEEVLALTEHELERGGVTVRRELAPDLPPIWAQEGQFHHVFMNFIRNALHAVSGPAPDGAARAAPVIRVRAAATAERDFVTVEVADNGPGVPEALRSRVFEPFFSTKERGEGMGLGLYITKEVVESLGGRIFVGTAPEGGALFRVQLPAAPASGAILR